MRRIDVGIVMSNFAALRAAVFPLFPKKTSGRGGYPRPVGARVNLQGSVILQSRRRHPCRACLGGNSPCLLFQKLVKESLTNKFKNKRKACESPEVQGRKKPCKTLPMFLPAAHTDGMKVHACVLNMQNGVLDEREVC